jgi:hypothetical protein
VVVEAAAAAAAAAEAAAAEAEAYCNPQEVANIFWVYAPMGR